MPVYLVAQCMEGGREGGRGSQHCFAACLFAGSGHLWARQLPVPPSPGHTGFQDGGAALQEHVPRLHNPQLVCIATLDNLLHKHLPCRQGPSNGGLSRIFLKAQATSTIEC